MLRRHHLQQFSPTTLNRAQVAMGAPSTSQDVHDEGTEEKGCVRGSFRSPLYPSDEVAGSLEEPHGHREEDGQDLPLSARADLSISLHKQLHPGSYNGNLSSGYSPALSPWSTEEQSVSCTCCCCPTDNKEKIIIKKDIACELNTAASQSDRFISATPQSHLPLCAWLTWCGADLFGED